jgi:hypothetical protein
MLTVLSRNTIQQNTLDDISNFNMIIISTYLSFCIYYNYIYNSSVTILKYYILSDFLLLTFKKKDMFLHHGLVLLIILYQDVYHIDVEINSFSTIQLYKTEVSSIFLGLSYFLKKNKNLILLQNISNILFLTCFCYFRIYNFYFNIISNPFYFNSVTTNNTNTQFLYQYTVTYSLFGLNIFWFIRILKIITKIY